MAPPSGILAFIVPGWLEWFLLLAVGLLLFGRRLPEVGRAVGRTIAELRRGFDQFKSEIDRDDSLRSARDSFRDARDSFGNLRRTVTAPRRRLSDPKRLFDDLTDPSRSVEAPAAEPDPGVTAEAPPDEAPRPDPGVTDEHEAEDAPRSDRGAGEERSG